MAHFSHAPKWSFTIFFMLAILVIPFLALADVTYTYDTRSRLEKVEYDNGTTVSYSYDSVGNRLEKQSIGLSTAIFEDAEDANILGWDIYDNNPTGASIANVYDEERASRVIEFIGDAQANGYRLRNNDLSYWDDTQFKVIEWAMKYSEGFSVYIAAQTKDGFRYIYYTGATVNNLGSDTYIHHGLGSEIADGNWHTISRDLEYDLKEAQPDNELVAILGFLIRGSGRVDDIATGDALPDTLDSDGDTISDNAEMNTYETDPYSNDSDGDGVLDGDELNHWGANWNGDLDADGLINILDADADNDGITDGQEIAEGTDPGDSASYKTIIVYEDAEDGTVNGWDIYDSSPTGALIENVYDDDRSSRVIELTGDVQSNGYRLRNDDLGFWYDKRFKVIEWSMKYSENFTIYIAAQTKDGFRYIYYNTANTDNLGIDSYVHHGLGKELTDGSWYTVIRDLEYDLKEAQPNNELISILGFYIRGSGKIDDIQTREAFPDTLDSDGDNLSDSDEINVYGTHPYYGDSDGDNISDGDELIHWGSNWNSDPDGDGLINILDTDSDNDGISDGLEVSLGTDPADSSSIPAQVMYEDAEDGTVSGWDVYDNTPTGALIENVFDNERSSNVISLTGSAESNGYRLRNEDFSNWNDNQFKVIEWSMKYSEGFTVYIATQTKDGFRYINYTPTDTDNLGAETYIHHGIGSGVNDGTWHTFTRDLDADLKDAQPTNEIESVLGFYIRGSGRVDNILTRRQAP